MKNKYIYHCNGCHNRFNTDDVKFITDVEVCPHCECTDLVISNENGKFSSDYSKANNLPLKNGNISYYVEPDGSSYVNLSQFTLYNENEVDKLIEFLNDFKIDIKNANEQFNKLKNN